MTVIVSIKNDCDTAVVDDEFSDVVLGMVWYRIRNAKGKHGACTFINGKGYSMHRLLLGLSPYERHVLVRHIDGDKLNNRLHNLKTIDHSQAAASMLARSCTGFKGVRFDKRKGLFNASIFKDGRSIWLGYFPSAIEAGCAYDEAASQIFGDCAALNGANYVRALTLDGGAK